MDGIQSSKGKGRICTDPLDLASIIDISNVRSASIYKGKTKSQCLPHSSTSICNMLAHNTRHFKNRKKLIEMLFTSVAIQQEIVKLQSIQQEILKLQSQSRLLLEGLDDDNHAEPL